MPEIKKQNIKSNFFNNEKADADKVASDLLGKFICRKFDDGTVLRWCIIETEAYYNNEEVTYKNQMFHGVGEWCPYNGMLMINCFSKEGKEGNDNILIRSVDCVKGPCKLAETLKIKEIKNEIIKQSVIDNEKLWIEDYGFTVKEEQDVRTGIVKKDENDEHLKRKKHYATSIIFPL